MPSGFLGDALPDIEFVAVAHPLRSGHKRKLTLSLIIANTGRPGPAACQLVQIIRSVIACHCKDKGGGCPAI